MDNEPNPTPGLADEKISMGDCLREYGEPKSAIAQYEAALKLDSRRVDVRCRLGSTLMDLGRFEEAIAQFELALEADPDFAPAYQLLGELAAQGQHQLSSEQVACMKTLAVDDHLPLAYRCTLQFTLADLLMKDGIANEAFDYYQAANGAQYHLLQQAGTPFDAEECRRTTDRTIACFNREFFPSASGTGLDTQTPVFVIGMPRSGTTLVQQILASHPQVAGAGELTDIAQLALAMPSLIAGDATYPECVSQAESPVFERLAQEYLHHRTEQHGRQVLRIVDKTPANFLFAGFIATLFPKARFIHCQRDPLDVCLSCYCRSFQTVTWATRFEDIAFFYREYRRLMEHWRSALPSPLFELHYEELVTAPEAVTRKLISFCDLPWDAGCLEHSARGEVVKTASRVQVRQPIYTSAVGRWKQHQQYLEPLRRAIQDLLVEDESSPSE